MEKCEIVFVILTYRNSDDLKECLKSLKKKLQHYKVVVVNSYYDNNSMNKIKETAEMFGADFLNVENRGYSYGNNVGISYAKQIYRFKYLVVSNPDIVIKKFPKDKLPCGDIIAPKIIGGGGKLQNPMWASELKVAEFLIYTGFKKKIKLFLAAGIGLNKARRTLFLAEDRLMHKRKYRIYMAHGSFVIFSAKAISRLGERFYDENMFLFAEESVLAIKAKGKGLSTFYVPDIVIRHKEDGSMKLSQISVNDELAKSNIYYYETYRKRRV